MLTSNALGGSPSTPNTRAARTIFVSKPSGMTHADGMSHLREWLDRKKLQSSSFKIIGGGEAGFEISFSSEHDAAQFQLFKWPVGWALPPG